MTTYRGSNKFIDVLNISWMYYYRYISSSVRTSSIIHHSIHHPSRYGLPLTQVSYNFNCTYNNKRSITSASSYPITFIKSLTTSVTPDTIYAIASGHNRCAITIIRISGPRSSRVFLSMTAPTSMSSSFQPQYHVDSSAIMLTSTANDHQHRDLPLPRQLIHCYILNGVTREVIDSGCAVWIPANQSVTGEDLVELHCHGSMAVITDVLAALRQLDTSTVSPAADTYQGSIRSAKPGEFTKRAYLNGKLDLMQVESLSDLLSAETQQQRQQSLLLLHGNSHNKISLKRWRNQILHCLSYIEAYIDFGEEEKLDDWMMVDNVTRDVQAVIDQLLLVLSNAHQGEIRRSGILMVLTGHPNAGKSSLLNCIMNRPVAIVDDQPGTTRDLMEVNVNLGGHSVILVDTAGIRPLSVHSKAVHNNSDNRLKNLSVDKLSPTSSISSVEAEGIKRAIDKSRLADVKILVVDGLILWKYFTGVSPDISHPLILSISEIDTVNSNIDTINSSFSRPQQQVIIVNKSDLLSSAQRAQLNASLQQYYLECTNGIKDNIVFVSAITGDGMDTLLDRLSQLATFCVQPVMNHSNNSNHSSNQTSTSDNKDNSNTSHLPCFFITRERHRAVLAECLNHLKSYIRLIKNINNNVQQSMLASSVVSVKSTHPSSGIEIACEELRLALKCLSSLTGEVPFKSSDLESVIRSKDVTEEVLDIIFRDFCIGK